MQNDKDHSILPDAEEYRVVDFLYHWSGYERIDASVEVTLTRHDEIRTLRFYGVENIEFHGSFPTGEEHSGPTLRDISDRGYEYITIQFELIDCGILLSFYATRVELVKEALGIQS